ncbi:nicotinate-nucleotide adenylyltransferase [Bordetella holmesii]|uniref:Probable nicotinate-nucleotide adenylyltransferase n=2 Tax=Bordetella holmesii TaxID=35814 RepID=A0A158M644_9BORD|nr:nicotinate-nucleotide adenylyltransferase [Bordetella holmesii]EWM45299.1 nicotinate (nicotinamide) nucleotide adenylyltransferase [Bordetella holmesii 70147]AMD44034.1 nicotinate-nucleotide adenylyltransferase [Bordetella holmesii H558]AMD50428.1 nicotinate-nucleotide adenylyltransferase [Bordetella holmesii F627]AOB36143.1 nicotinate (nicotinamide) nucleotide adenylyltransferase [Bordetella holmesii]AUL20115.1 nicotinate (nicotinamide) nucleotide adenylyltransferase [Bordetella holmesii]
MKQIGLLGGSFDPIHLAHLALAQSAMAHLGLHEVQFIPAANPWQRAPLLASPADRLAMIKAAIAGQPGLAVNSTEIDRGGATYTVDTVRALPAAATFTWILGADQLANFCTWRDWQEIVRRVDLAVATRPGTPLQAPDALAVLLAQQGKSLRELPFTPMAISASDIRQRLASGQSTAGLLPAAVSRYIAEHGLYLAA